MTKILSLAFTILISAYVSSVYAEDSWYLGALYNAQETSRDFDTAGVTAIDASTNSGSSSQKCSDMSGDNKRLCNSQVETVKKHIKDANHK
ncbi:hypothetical protein CXF85_08780 [Colwellia sp. 75C3]|uniref:hypothetical protein n=1 Tax=Colwellia sp. 75C3 TaxID=888425 RepID=UPI000C3401E7|nr:hypothetical protein [Colwellia sp. 75C3]PKG84288.1 hypothetical protein CXF85_08780 [Colwellia sp. 75C3]